jgi:hypothetical protein
MKMKQMAIAASTMLLVLAASAATAQEIAVRAGVVTAMQAVQGKTIAVSNPTKRQLGGMLGRALGRAIADSSGYSYETANAVANLGADVASAGGAESGAASYMLMIKFNDATESAFTRDAAQLGGIRVGSRVKVVGSGDGAMIVTE